MKVQSLGSASPPTTCLSNVNVVSQVTVFVIVNVFSPTARLGR
ncbi:hypothetical protein ACFQWG_08065 [Schaalia naturae]|uniref:Uncharacterized protein n=1 Tax=Schaalia naturae TaxID=635203 RepID=A0ABW2SMU1_9ACTO